MSFTKWLTERDIYGVPITVLYKGSDVYKTRMGAMCTILTYALLLVSLISLTQSFIDRSKQESNSQTLFFDRYNAGRFYLEENNFKISFGTPYAIPDKIGRLTMKIVKNNGEGQIVPLEPVDQKNRQIELDFWKEHGNELDPDKVSFLTPSNYADLYIEGEGTYNTRFTYITFELEMCYWGNYKAEEPCASLEETNKVLTEINIIYIRMQFQQLDMDNFEQPLATATILEGLSITPG